MSRKSDSGEGDNDLKKLMETLSGQLPPGLSDPTGTVAVLISETVKYRDRLNRDSGITLTVEDTRLALDALEACLTGKTAPPLTPVQNELADIYRERLLQFGNS